MYCEDLSADLQATLLALAHETHRHWATDICTGTGDDSFWLKVTLTRAGLSVTEGVLECFRLELVAHQMSLCSNDRSRLKDLLTDPAVREAGRHLKKREDYERLEQLLIERFSDEMLTETRLQALSRQMTRYIVRGGDTHDVRTV